MTQGERTGRRQQKIAPLRCSLLASAACLLPGLFVAGCGAPAAPQPPTLNLPQPVRDLTAAREGDTVHLTFSVPQKTTDKLPVRGDMTAKLCRSTDESAPCEPAGTLALSTQKTAAMDDALPADLTQGPPRLLIYRVAIQNHAAKVAGVSAPAFAVAGAPPLPLAGFTTTPRRDGILLMWQSVDVPADASEWVRFDRTRTGGPSTPPESGLGGGKSQEEPAEQGLRVPEGSAEHRPAGAKFSFALDATAHTGRSYRYLAYRVEQVELGRHTLEVSSAASAPLTVAYTDVFPPPVPAGLVSAVDTHGKAIDLSWSPDVDPEIAGYIVYRRVLDAGTANALERISPREPVPAPAWSDTTIVAGQRYAYSISAIDTSGNESKRSAEVEDGLSANAP